MVFFRDIGEVNRCIGVHGVSLCGHLKAGKLEDFDAVHPTDASKCSCIDKGDFWCFRGSSQGMKIGVTRVAEACKGRDIGDELSVCGVVSNEILPSTQSIDGLYVGCIYASYPRYKSNIFQ